MDKTLSFKEKILLAQAAKERVEIITKYDKGRENVVRHDIDPWEDPEFQVYHVTDRYGFIHENPIIEKGNEKSKMAEIARSKKWVKMLQDECWLHYYPSDKLTRRIYKGIPLAVRGSAWVKLLNIPKLLAENEGVYERMKLIGRKWSLEVRQVDLDVNRTFRDHVMFRKRYDVKQQALFNILVAYSMYNSEVGYCQGMSQIAALVLMYLNEEDAFWALVSLLNGNKHGMHGFFVPGFPKLLRYQEHLNKVLKKFIPRVKRHLDRNEMYPPLYTVKWFLQCFLDRIPFSLTLRFWDIYILEGEVVLIALALTVIKLHRARILKMNMEELMDFFQNKMSKEFNHSDDHAISVLRATLDDLKKAKLEVPLATEESEKQERPTKPLGAFEAPTVEQMINEFEKEHKAIDLGTLQKNESENKVDDDGEPSKLRAKTKLEIPADGGPDAMPSSMNHRFSQMIDLESESGTGEDTLREIMSEVTATSDRRSSETSFTGSEFPSPGISACSAFSPNRRPHHLPQLSTTTIVTSASKPFDSFNNDLILYRYCKMDKNSQELDNKIAKELKSANVREDFGLKSISSSSSSINSQPHLRFHNKHLPKSKLLSHDEQEKSLSQLLQELNDLIPKCEDIYQNTTSVSRTPAPITSQQGFSFDSDSEQHHSPVDSLVIRSPGSPFNDSPNSELPWFDSSSPRSVNGNPRESGEDDFEFSRSTKKVSNSSDRSTVCIVADNEPRQIRSLNLHESKVVHRILPTDSKTLMRPIISSFMNERIRSANCRSGEIKTIPIQHIPSKNKNINEVSSAPPFSPLNSTVENSRFDWPKRTVYWSLDNQFPPPKPANIMTRIPVYHMQSIPVVQFNCSKIEPADVKLFPTKGEERAPEFGLKSNSTESPSIKAVCTIPNEIVNNISVKKVSPLLLPKSFSKKSKFISRVEPYKSDALESLNKQNNSADLKINKTDLDRPSKTPTCHDQNVQNGPIAEPSS